MANQILQSVIEITGQRDLDSLEFSLVASLAEMLPVSSISIYKKHSESITSTVEEVLHLQVSTGQRGKQNYQWSDTTRIVNTDEVTEQCLSTSTLASKKINNGYRSAYPISSDNIIVGSLTIDSHEDVADKAEIIETIIKIYSNYLVILVESERDKLTGMFNRRTFDKKLARLLQSQAKKNELYLASGGDNKRHHSDLGETAWLVVVDFDNFKTINDTYGHVYGDEILLTLSQKMKDYFRHSDLLFRFGGDEFVIVLEPISYDSAYDILEEFRNMIADTSFPLVGKITISAGFSRITKKDYAPAVLNRADKALYHAKESGRNTVCNYELLLEQGLLTHVQAVGAVDLF